MQPEARFVTISDNKAKIEQLIQELVLAPRLNALKWSQITKQTPNIKIGYPGQHLASLITGVLGERTGARGNDLMDGSEVKSCSRVDQLDVCKTCKSPVSRSEDVCPTCNSTDILRKDDSKWLFSIRSENELNTLTKDVKRVLLLIADHPNFSDKDFSSIRFQAYEIWTNHPRCSRFNEIMSNYYYKIYLAHKAKDPTKNPAPKNFWPYQYQFYMCNPVLTFSCLVKNANTSPEIIIEHYLDPKADRNTVQSVVMPADILTDKELEIVLTNTDETEIKKYIDLDLTDFKKLSIKQKKSAIKGINEKMRSVLPLRDTDRISTAKSVYSRRKSLIEQL